MPTPMSRAISSTVGARDAGQDPSIERGRHQEPVDDGDDVGARGFEHAGLVSEDHDAARMSLFQLRLRRTVAPLVRAEAGGRHDHDGGLAVLLADASSVRPARLRVRRTVPSGATSTRWRCQHVSCGCVAGQRSDDLRRNRRLVELVQRTFQPRQMFGALEGLAAVQQAGIEDTRRRARIGIGAGGRRIVHLSPDRVQQRPGFVETFPPFLGRRGIDGDAAADAERQAIAGRSRRCGSRR